MAQSIQNLSLQRELMEELVDELMAEHPDPAVVQALSGQLGIPYLGHQVEQLEMVLQNIEHIYKTSNKSNRFNEAPELEG